MWMWHNKEYLTIFYCKVSLLYWFSESFFFICIILKEYYHVSRTIYFELSSLTLIPALKYDFQTFTNISL